ncbi:hypothetical protein [Streptococcus varani]|uniref:hypothetical protein n=1 Tax=Streptococcus varani TaxID=1608583 RepID=UPI000B8A0D8B|nr:hypothetical protein [Streptococcus varani]
MFNTGFDKDQTAKDRKGIYIYMSNIIGQSRDSLQIVESSPFENYLKSFGLPFENVIASTADKYRVSSNLPDLLNTIPQSHRQNAMYMSEFISSVAIGRFDSALNDLWNEVVETLRNKADSYGLDLFFDSAVSGDKRSFFSSKDDFIMLKDIVLVQTCGKLEIISEITQKKLLHILDMRNNIGGSHPTREIISPLLLLGWVEDCINNVFLDETSSNSLEVKKIINGIGQNGLNIDDNYLLQLDGKIKDISITLTNNLLKILFKKYVSSQNDILTNNIRKIAPTVWINSDDRMKYELGLDIDSYSLNLEKDKETKAKEFFDICDGNRYKSNGTRSIALSVMIDELENIHYSFDNFYHEGPKAKDIMSYIEQSADIPDSVAEKLLSVILTCRLGNSYDVARSAVQYYDRLFDILNQDQVKTLLKYLFNQKQQLSQNLNSTQDDILKEILTRLHAKTYTSDRIKDTLNYLINSNGDFVNKKILTRDFRRHIELL